MNTAQIKLVTWSVAGVLGLGLVAYIADFLRRRDTLMQQVSTDQMRGVLEKVPAAEQRAENIVALASVQKGLQRYDWTGKPPPEPVIDTGPVEAPKHGPDPVDKFVKVRGLKVDAEQPDRGEVVLKYTSEARVTAVGSADGSVLKLVGDTLDAPLNYIKVASVTEAGVEFSFTEPPGRAHEILQVNDYQLLGFMLVDGDAIVKGAAPRERIPTSAYVAGPNPKTQMISPNRFRLGVDDMQYINDHYPDILSEEVSYKRHRDPKTGRFDGIEITSVKAGSIASQHGLQNGDVIKSINGNPVNSESEAIQFVKTHKDEYDTWEVEIMNKGQTRTVTYNSPQN